MSKSLASDTKQGNFFRQLMANPYFLLILAPLFWSGNIVAGKLAVGHVDTFTLLVGRWLGAVLIVTPFAIRHLQRDWHAIKPALLPLLLFGALGFASFNILMYKAAHYTTALNISIEQAAIPIFVFIGNLVFFAVKPKFLQVIGLGLTIAGVIWVTTHGDPAKILNLSVNIGDGMVIFACILYALYSLLLRIKPDIHWLSFIFVTAAGALITSIFYQVTMGGGIDKLIQTLPQTTTLGWLCIVYVMVFPSIFAQLFYARGLEIVGPNRASIFINLLPVFGTILSVIIIGEAFQAFHVVASILVILGIILSEYSVRKPQL